MVKVVALQAWSNGSYSMDEKSVAEIPDALATELIAKGVVAESPDYYGGGGSGGGVLVVTDTGGTLDKTWQEINDAGFGVVSIGADGDISYMPIVNVYRDSDEYAVGALDTTQEKFAISWYLAASADSYPEKEQE